MTANEISDKISTFERELADIAVRIRNAEETIRQLQCLKDSCVDYQEEFENHKHRRIQRMEYAVNGSEFKPQAFEKMCGAPDNVIIENGTVYFTEYVDGTEIKWEADIPNGWYNREKLFEEMEEI